MTHGGSPAAAPSPDEIVPPDFDRLYADDPDPWQVGSSWYERRKLGIVVASLTRERYAAAWDPACGTGHLARALAERADHVLATDLSPRAVELARRTCAGVDQVELARLVLPERPSGPRSFDLVAIAEFWYYLTADDRRAALRTVQELAAPRAEIVSLHWRHRPHDAFLSGAEVQQEIVGTLTADGWRCSVHHDDEDFVLDVIVR